MATDTGDAPLIESRSDLIEALSKGNKPKSAWRLGTEHEKFVYYKDSLKPVPYGGNKGIKALLEGIKQSGGWQEILDDGQLIGLQGDKGGAISLEPGGQFELSGAPLETVHQTCLETGEHLKLLQGVADPLGICFLGLGTTPDWALADIPQMPKSRYNIMAPYMEKVGTLGTSMMFRSCTVQVNLDFASEADMVKKLRVSLALQPFATALFANSPFIDGKPSGLLSFRSNIWKHTDADRSGMLPFAFEDGMGFERYVDYALDVPMYFVRRDGHYINTAGESFRAFLDGKLPQLPGEKPTITDFEDHLSTIFPEVRLKQFLEMRGADGGPWAEICALPAFWAGLLYDQSALDAAWDLVKDWTAEERQNLRDDVPATALKTTFRNTNMQELAKQVLAISTAGLESRAKLNWEGADESVFLTPLNKIVETGTTRAERLLAAYNGEWNGDITRAYADSAY